MKILEESFNETVELSLATSSEEFFMIGALTALSEAEKSKENVESITKELTEFVKILGE